LFTAIEPDSTETARIREEAADWLLKAADVAFAAAASPEAVRHIRAAFDFVDPQVKAHLHERIGEMTGGDAGIDDYRQALELYEKLECPIDDQLRAVAGILMVAMRWVGSVADRPSTEYVNGHRVRGRQLLRQATDRYAIGRFLAADAFFPFWVQAVHEVTPVELQLAEDGADEARKIAIELGDADLESAALDAAGSAAQSVGEWARARDAAYQRMKFESKLSFYERVDTHSMATWMSYMLGDLDEAERVSADIATRLLRGQAPYQALHLFAWRAMTLYQLGRWEEAVAAFWRAVDAWHDGGMLAAGYAIRGFVIGVDIGRARRDPRLTGAATEAIESILARYPPDNISRHVWPPYLASEGPPDEAILQFAGEGVERQVGLACDLRQKMPDDLIDRALRRAAQIRVPLVEAQLLRARGLQRKDAGDMSAAISIWERCGARTQMGRGLAERGMINGNAAEIDAGLAMLKKIGDVNYVDRFSEARI
jgi:tetratricopeptide (TPR) repeat protein